jgi:hypothetical protein
MRNNEQKEQIYLNENNLSRACHRNAILIGWCCAGGSPARQPGRACHHLPNRPRVCQPGRRGCSQSDRSRQWDDGVARAPSKAVPGESGLTHAALIAPQTLSLRHRNSLVSASDAPRATCFLRSAMSISDRDAGRPSLFLGQLRRAFRQNDESQRALRSFRPSAQRIRSQVRSSTIRARGDASRMRPSARFRPNSDQKADGRRLARLLRAASGQAATPPSQRAA